MYKEKRIDALGVLSDYLVSCIPSDFQSRDDVVFWLENSPYSPYVALYGGESSLNFNKRESFVSAVDSKRRYMLQDEITFKFENFYNIDNEIMGVRAKMSEAIKAENLFMAYPGFRDINVSIHISQANNGAMSGANYYKENRIEVFASNNEDAMRALLHELQHSIQAKEGFALGESYYQEDGVADLFVGFETEFEDEIVDGAFSSIVTKAKMAEIDDYFSKIIYSFESQSKMALNKDFSIKLENIFYHPSLFKIYPKLKDINVFLSPNSEKNSFNRDTNTITIGYDKFGKSVSQTILLHEIQHAIQQAEGWARGGTPLEFIADNKFEIMQDIKDLEAAILLKNPKNSIENYELLTGNGVSDRVYELLEEWGEQELHEELDRLKVYDSPYESYKRLWGEQQARATENRFSMTLDERISEDWTETLKRVEGVYRDPIVKFGEVAINQAIELENRYLDKNGKVDENLILEDGVGRLPKYVTSFEKFEKLFKNKINVRYASIETPVGAISVHLRNAFKHLTSNTNYENRIKYSGGFISVFSDPLFVVKDIYNGKDIRIFYKPMISKNKAEGLLHFVGYGINDRGEIENSTYFDVKASKLERYIKTAEENLLFYKYAGSNCFRSVSPNLELGNTHTCDRILSEKKDDVKVSSKESQKERLKEWHKDSHTLTKKDDGSPRVFYHGTNVEFSEFDREKARAGWLSKGFYFTNELIEAKDYGSRIIASYITLKNPFVIKGDIVQADGTVEWAKSTKEQFVEALPHVENFKIEDASRHLENIGYDGIINAAHIVAFSPSQIKSIHNRGTFEENNPNILEKNDFGLKRLEKALSIVRTGASIERVSKYLSCCGLSLENVKNTIFADSFSKDGFVNTFSFNKGLVDKESDYYKNAGECEAREIEDMYVSISAAIKVDDEILKMSDEQRKSAIDNLFVSPDKSLDVVV